jgi:hypothetical protein
MVTLPESHDVTLQAPWYAPAGRAVAIQRYLDPGFVQQFQADASNAPAGRQAELFGWEQEDSMPVGQGSVLKLRRPVHKTFYVVAWEACCKLPTLPAIAPEKIESAGFVIRSGSAAAPLGFQIVQGKSQGWGPVEPLADPDAVRGIKALGLVPRSATPNPGYTGEETFPLHPLPVQDAGNPHTLLFGYLPIGGGTYMPPSPPAPPTDTGDSMLQDLPWPFGLAGFSNGPPGTYTFDQQIKAGQIDSAMAALLRILLGRYQLVDPDAWNDPQNGTLVGILDGLAFYTDPATPLSGQALRDWAAASPAPGSSTLGAVLRDYAATPAPASAGSSLGPAAPTITTAQMFFAALMQADPASSSTPLPASAKLPASAQNLLVIEADAARIRAALRLRLVNAQAVSSAAMPVPKLVSGPNGRYFVMPFLRTMRPDGCIRIYWGPPSEPFAVAAAFDPDAARPSLIEMPGLADAKKGLARGAAFDIPPDLADLMNGLTSSSAVQKMWSGGGPSGGLGIRFLCSFSLPVITICAMLMLSIVISLLNIFLGWMAWVKICIPLPSKK